MKVIFNVFLMLALVMPNAAAFAQGLNKEIVAIPLTLINIETVSGCTTSEGLEVGIGEECQYLSKALKVPIDILDNYFSLSAGIYSAQGLPELSIKIRFSNDSTSWSEWVQLENDAHGNNDDVNFTSKQCNIANEYDYFQFNLIVKNNGLSNVLLKQFEVRFLSIASNYFSNQNNGYEIEDNTNNRRLSCSCNKPSVISRTGWACPDGQNYSGPGAPSYTTVTHLIVHHEACGPSTTEAACNTPPPGGWAQRVYSTWDYHTSSPPTGNGWDDIGYNYLVDPNGVIYEGRGGGENVVGAHFCGSNGGTMGACVLGRYNNTQYTNSIKNSLTELLAWKACDVNIDPSAIISHSSSGQNLYTISGHKDHNSCSSRDCPGTAAYNYLPILRTNVANYINNGCQTSTTCTDTYEPNNSYQTAYNVTGSTPFYNTTRTINLQSKIFSANDYDWYLIGMDGPGKLTIDMTSLPANYYMEIYNMGGLSPSNYIDGSDEAGTANEQIIYCQNFLVSTFIYLTVYTNGAFDDCDDYDLRLNWIPGVCPTSCPSPTNLSESSIATTSASLSWSVATGAQGYEVQYMTSGGSWSATQTVTGTSRSISGLLCGENYQWRVRSACTGGTFSAWVTNSFSTSTCPPVGCPATNDNCSNAETVIVNGSCRNGDVCSATQSLAPGTNCNAVGTPVSNYARDVWFTFNAPQPGNYTISVNPGSGLDAVLDIRSSSCNGSSVGCADSGGGAGGSESTTLNLAAGTYYVRVYHYTVAGNFPASNSDFELCVTSSIVITPSCDDPTNLIASNPQQEEIDLDWDDVVPTADYEIEYKILGSGNWQSDNSSNSSQTIDNLQCDTIYNWRVRTDCGGGDYSNWVNGPNFVTLPCCNNVSLNNVNGTSVVCVGTQETYSVNFDPDYTYNWQLSSGGTITSGQGTETIQVNWATSGQHMLEVTAANTCDNETEDISVVVEANGLPTVQIPSTLQTCAADPLTVTATYTIGGANPSFSWYLNGNLQSGQNSSKVFTGLSSGDEIQVWLASSSSCATSQTVMSNIATVQVLQAQPVAVTINASNTQVCSGGTVTFTSSSNSTGSSPTYDWMVNGNSTGSNSDTYTLNNFTANTSVVCVLTSSLTCLTGNPASSNTINVAVTNPVAPSIQIAVPNSTICSDETVIATATIQNGGSSPSVTWLVNGNVLGQCQNQTTCSVINLNDGDVLTSHLASSDTCVTSTTATANNIPFTVLPAPNLVASASANQVCPGDSLVLYANGAGSYIWTATNGFTANVANTVDFPLVPTVYTVTAETNGCDTSTTFTVGIKPAPITNAVPSDTTICLGDNVLLQLESTTVNGYQWGPSGSGLSSTSGNTDGITKTNSNWAKPTASTTYVIAVNLNNGCSSMDTVQVNVVDTPQTPILDTVGGLTVINPPSGNATYYWLLNGQVIDSTVTPFYRATSSGNYQVVVKTNQLCSSSVSNHVGFVGMGDSEASLFAFEIYPNPNNGYFTVSFKGLNMAGWLNVYNSLGQHIGTYYVAHNLQLLNLDLSAQPAGMYLLHFHSDKLQMVRKMLIN